MQLVFWALGFATLLQDFLNVATAATVNPHIHERQGKVAKLFYGLILINVKLFQHTCLFF